MWVSPGDEWLVAQLKKIDTVGMCAFVKLRFDHIAMVKLDMVIIICASNPTYACRLFMHWTDPRLIGWDAGQPDRALPKTLWGPKFNLANSFGAVQPMDIQQVRFPGKFIK